MKNHQQIHSSPGMPGPGVNSRGLFVPPFLDVSTMVISHEWWYEINPIITMKQYMNNGGYNVRYHSVYGNPII